MQMHRSTLGDFLRARRDECQPEDVGVEREYGRRVPGLRRDEVAALSGISSEYYVRLEQGRVATPSRQVIDAIARALRLNAVSTDHMYRLCGIGSPRAGDLSPRTSEAIETILMRWRDTPAYLMDRNLDIVAANTLMVAISGGSITAGVNTLELTFTPEVIASCLDWEPLARETVGAFRYLGDPTSARYREVLTRMSRNESFTRIWAANEVRLPLGREVRSHAEGIGELRIDYRNFTPADLPGYTITVYSAEPGSFTDSVIRRLAEGAGLAA
ncbi:helix-turn-helix transcriptional regulator [Microbacterium sp. NPDC091313]